MQGAWMQGTCLAIFVGEIQRHEGKLLFEWLLEQAQKIGIGGGTAMRAIAGYGRHGKLHEETFFELAGDLPVEVKFLVSDEQANALLELVRQHKLNLLFIKTPVEYGVTL